MRSVGTGPHVGIGLADGFGLILRVAGGDLVILRVAVGAIEELRDGAGPVTVDVKVRIFESEPRPSDRISENSCCPSLMPSCLGLNGTWKILFG
jgi:hypothetical protein